MKTTRIGPGYYETSNGWTITGEAGDWITRPTSDGGGAGASWYARLRDAKQACEEGGPPA